MADLNLNGKARTATFGFLRAKYILIVAVLAALVSVAVLFYWWQIKIGVANMPQTLDAQKTTEAPKPLDTSNWKTYKDETYGFQFRYPKEWYVEKEEGRFFLFDSSLCQGTCPTKKSQVGFGVENNDGLLSISEWLKQNVATVGIETDIPLSADSFEGIKRIYQQTGGAAAVLVMFSQKDKLGTLYYFETSGNENRRILDEILASFKF